MIFNRIILVLSAMVALVSLSWAQSQGGDIEDRFVQTDYSKKISMDFKNVSLVDVLKIFSKESGKNFISAQDVSSKKVTVFLDNIPVEEALDKVLDANDLTYEMTPNSDIFIVKPKSKDQDMITKVFPLKYASVSSSKLSNPSAGKSGGKGSGITGVVKGILSKGGKMEEDSRTNSFIITDLPSQFPLIEETIAKLDVPVLQILIQVEILDVSKAASDQMGIQYGQTPVTFAGGSRTLLYPFDQNMILRKSAGGSASNSAPDLKYTTGNIDFSGMKAQLDFLESRTDTRNLARPRLLTLNNEPSAIKITTDEVIAVENLTSSVDSTGTQTGSQVIRAMTGVTLSVTPQANAATGEILLSVSPTVSDAPIVEFAGDGHKYGQPETTTSQSILRVKNGETVIIGGLLRKINSNVVSKLPILGDLPFVGGAFRHKDKSSSERELIIFITPYIVDDKIKEKLNNEAIVHLNREVSKLKN